MFVMVSEEELVEGVGAEASIWSWEVAVGGLDEVVGYGRGCGAIVFARLRANNCEE